MVSKLIGKLKKHKTDNRGAAIIVVIVAIAFIGMLIAMLTYMAYYNYLMKHVDRSSKDNFYSAEYALDVLNAGLQKDISDSMAEAYIQATKSSAGLDADMINSNFKAQYLSILKKKVAKRDPSNPSNVDLDHWDTPHLTKMWDDAGLTLASAAGVQGAWLEAKEGNDSLTASAGNDYITLYNLHIVYTDDKGYVSIIDTDIRLKVPTMDFAQSASNLNVEQYSLIANNSIINDNLNDDEIPSFSIEGDLIKGDPDTEISGNVYGGKKGVSVGNSGGIKFIEDPSDKAEDLGLNYKLIADSINVNNSLTKGVALESSFDTYVDDINVASGKFVGDGNMYVGDDLDIAGKKSNVTLKGIYRGYGNENTGADGSSSILINGAKTTLNCADLKELTLGGHAYVGAKRYDADIDRLKLANGIEDTSRIGTADDYTAEDIAKIMQDTDPVTDKINQTQEDYDKIVNSDHFTTMVDNAAALAESNGETYSTVPKNEADILTGESISVKANQLFYMVPSECIGYIRGTSQQKYARNPMTYDEYKYLCEEFDYNKFTKKNDDGVYVYPEYAEIRSKYLLTHTLEESKEVPKEDIDADKVPDDLRTFDPVRLSVLWEKMGSPAYTTKEPKAVYRRVNGTVMVYLYLDFASDEMMANQFYKAYYEYDKDSVNMYVGSYIESLKWNNALNSNLTLAGNAFRMNGSDVVLIEDTLENSTKYKNLLDYQEVYSEKYESLMHTLRDDAALMTSIESVTDLFDNLVDASELNRIDNISGRSFTDGTVRAYVGKSNVVYPSDTCPAETAVIITSGDVYVRGDFNGLIISGGNIYVCNGCNKITYNPEKALKGLRLSYDNAGSTVYVYDVFGPSGALSYGLGVDTASGGDSVAVNELITYENWKKE